MTLLRYKLFEKRSLAHRLFKRHHTHFNDMYWSQRTVFRHIFSQTKNYTRQDSVTSLFQCNSGEYRSQRTLGDWGNWYSDFDRWTRMSYIIGLAGYLETYIAQVSTAAFESTPSIILGGGPKVDGASFLKNNPDYDLYRYSERLTRGDWQSRISAYKDYFGQCPFEGRLSDLEKLRKLRNNAGHSFGRDIKSMKFAQGWVVQKLPNISDGKIMLFLELAETVANEIDSHIAEEYIGQYEIIKIYHNWLNTVPHIRRRGKKVLAKEFKKHFYELTSSAYTPVQHLIDYYDGI